MLAIIGIVMLYSTAHFFVVSFNKRWSERTDYEKCVTIAGMISIVLVYIGTME